MRVVVAMSGGVDSSVAAGLMVEAGHQAVGLTLRLLDEPIDEPTPSRACCSADDLDDARAACDALGIPHYVVDEREAFRDAIIKPFAHSYLRGRTPNPCVLCNTQLKFSSLLQRAGALGAGRLVTGHYARIRTGPGGPALLRGIDRGRDQSYFLFGMDAAALAATWFPLGEMDKAACRAVARRLGLPNAEKPDSEDICFVPGGDYSAVVEAIAADDGIVPRPGAIVDRSGQVLGAHGGVHRFTVGQRKGLGLGGGRRRYVISIDAPRARVVVGGIDELAVTRFRVIRCHWIGSRPMEGAAIPCDVQIRYRHQGAPARIVRQGSGAEVRLETPAHAIAPGQAAVFYDGDRVLGGGWIAGGP